MLLNLFVENWVGENIKVPYSTGQEVKQVVKKCIFWLGLINKFLSQPTITCSKLNIEALEEGVKYVQN